MSNSTAVTNTTNIKPVQGLFQPEPTFDLITFIGPAGTPFLPPINPIQSGLTITGSTIDSSVIGGTAPAAGYFTSIYATTGQVATTPSADADIANKAYVDSVAQGLDVKASCVYATTNNITLSGLAVQAGGDWVATLTAGDRILVKNQTAQAANGIYVASASGWTRSADMNTWAEVPSAFTFVESGTTLSDTGWVCTSNQGGTIDVTPITWSQFSGAGSYLAGTGLTLTGNTFSITNTAVTAAAYGSASQVATFTVNPQGQLTLAASTSIAIAASQVTSGTIDSARLSGSYTGITGLGTLTDLTVTNTITGSISGNAGTATTATTATNLGGGASGSVPYQTGAGATSFLAVGANGQVLTLAAGVPTWATPTVGTVTSVGGTGTVSGISLSGTVTSSGNLTLGGTLDLSSPPTIGNTTPNTGKFTTLTVNDNTTLGTSNSDTINFVGRVNSDFDPATDNTYDLGRVGHEWRDLYIDGTANIDSLIADTADINAGTIDNTTIGATTASTGKFTTIDFSSTLAVSGSTGSAGQVLQSNGASAPTWVTPTAYATVTDDTTTNGTRYPLFADQTTGNLTTQYVSSTKFQFNPSTGTLSATVFSGSAASLTSLPAGQLTGTIPSGVLGNSTVYIGTTAIALNRATASQSLTGVSIDGSAGSATNATNATNTAITDDTTTAADMYPTWVTSTTGNLPQKVSSTKLKFNPSTGVLTMTGGTGGGNF